MCPELYYCVPSYIIVSCILSLIEVCILSLIEGCYVWVVLPFLTSQSAGKMNHVYDALLDPMMDFYREEIRRLEMMVDLLTSQRNGYQRECRTLRVAVNRLDTDVADMMHRYDLVNGALASWMDDQTFVERQGLLDCFQRVADENDIPVEDLIVFEDWELDEIVDDMVADMFQ